MRWQFGHSGVTRIGDTHTYSIPTIDVEQDHTGKTYSQAINDAYNEAMKQVPEGCRIWYGISLATHDEVIAAFGEQ